MRYPLYVTAVQSLVRIGAGEGRSLSRQSRVRLHAQVGHHLGPKLDCGIAHTFSNAGPLPAGLSLKDLMQRHDPQTLPIVILAEFSLRKSPHVRVVRYDVWKGLPNDEAFVTEKRAEKLFTQQHGGTHRRRTRLT